MHDLKNIFISSFICFNNHQLIIVKAQIDHNNRQCESHSDCISGHYCDTKDGQCFEIWFEAEERICPDSLPKVGDRVRLTESETVLKSELSKVGYGWEDEMKFMLGKVYEVLLGTNDIVVALNSPNGEQNGKWFFPKTAIYCHSEAGIRRPQRPGFGRRPQGQGGFSGDSLYYM